MISGVSHGAGFKGAVGYITGKDEATLLDLRGVMSERTAAAEMRAVAAQSERVQKPVYHRWFRVPEGERLTDEQWLAVVDKAEKAIGLEGHQRIVVRHGEDHVHAVWNRVDPESYKAQRVSHDYAKVEAVCRQAEREYGLQVVPGHHSWKQAGTEQPPAALVATPAEVRHQDRTGRPPFARIVEDSGAQAFCDATSWQDLTDRLQRAGLSLQAYRQGLTVTDGTERAGVSAITGNEWTRAKLERRFGQTWADFQASRDDSPTPPPAAPLRQRQIQDRPEREALREQYAAYRQQCRAQGREVGKGLFDRAWKEEQAQRAQEAAARRLDTQQRKALTRAVFSKGVMRSLTYKAIERRQEKQAARDRAQARERWEATKAELRAAAPRLEQAMDYREWLVEQASRGHDAARQQLDWINRKGIRPPAAYEPQAPTTAPRRLDQSPDKPTHITMPAAAAAKPPQSDKEVAAEWQCLVDERTATIQATADRQLASANAAYHKHDRAWRDLTAPVKPAEPTGLSYLNPKAWTQYKAQTAEYNNAMEEYNELRSYNMKLADEANDTYMQMRNVYEKLPGKTYSDAAQRTAIQQLREEHPEKAKQAEAIQAKERQEKTREQTEKRREEALQRFQRQRQQERDNSRGRGGRG